MKKLFVILLSALMVLGLVGCAKKEEPASASADLYPESFKAFMDVLDTDFSLSVDQFISEQGDDPVLGFRGAGSPAEMAVVEFMEKTMKEIGLQNVTVDEVGVDGWVFKGASVTFTNAEGESQTVNLGGYQTTCKAENETVELMWLNRGIEEDYEGVDPTGKLILIDINQNEDWWIDKPALEAKLRGAKAVIAMSELPTEDEAGNRIGTQDICGPADAPAFGISSNDRDALKAAIDASGSDSIEVVFNADSEVLMDTKSHCVWGEIPGKSDEVVYMFAHMDGYFHSYFDDASGDGLLMGVAKAMIDSGYEPNKTIRFVCNGAEEFGRSDSEADWAIGAYELIHNVHPEWAEKAFGIVNIDGAYCVEGETTFGVAVCEELEGWAREIADPLIATTNYTYRYLVPQSTYKEDFNYLALGIPSVGTAKGSETIFYDLGYHTSYDDREVAGFDNDTWVWMHELFGRYVYAMDETPARPLDFGARFESLKESYDEELVQDEELMNLIDEVIAASAPITEKINSLNASYKEAVAAKDDAKAAEILTEAEQLNVTTRALFKEVQDAILYLDGELSIVFPHETRQDNIANLTAALKSLEEGDAEEAVEEYLSCVGNGWYAMFFSMDTLNTDEARYAEGLKNTWAEGKTDTDSIAINETVKSLMAKGNDAEYSSEMVQIEKCLNEQVEYLNSVIAKEKVDFTSIVASMKAIAE